MACADYTQLRDQAVSAARLGGVAAMQWFRRPDLEIELKADESPVTAADQAAEQVIRACIFEQRPDDSWIGEETGSVSGSTDYNWICDPIDGTRNFIRGIPLWATLVACEHSEHGVVAAAVYIPALDEMYEAYLGGGARCDGQSIQVSTIETLEHSLFCFETMAWFENFGLLDVYMRMHHDTALQRGISDAYAHMLIASGCAECMIEPSLSVWDVAASSLIVSEAGGRFSDLHGAANIRSQNAVISNGHVHQACLQHITAGESSDV